MRLEKLYKQFGRVFKDGEVIFRQGDIGHEMYLIQSGKVKVIRETEQGKKIIATLKKGDFFGEMAIFDDLPRSATVEAEGETRLIVFDRQTIKTSLKTFPEIAAQLLEMMSRRLRLLDEQIEKLLVEREVKDKILPQIRYRGLI